MTGARRPPGGGPIDPQVLAALADQIGAIAEVKRDEPMSRHTTWRVGGPADLYAIARSADQLAAIVGFGAAAGVPIHVLGAGSNSLVSDRGIRGLVVSNRAAGVSIEAAGRVTAESGAPIAGLARQVAEAGLSGLEWAAAVPGTVGAAVFGNAGAHGGDIAGILEAADLVDLDGTLHRASPADLGLGYRRSDLNTAARRGEPRRRIVTRATFRLQPAEPAAIEARMKEYVEHRRATQPFKSSAGSVFQNPPGNAAGRLIDQAGLKGTTIGGAQISPKHANFIVNRGEATAADVIALIRLAHDRVLERFGVDLELEVLRLGEWGDES